MQKLKILELTNFSAGVCGVWQRVKQESELLSKKGHEVLILSSNSIKSTKLLAPKEETLDKIKIIRFPFKKIGGESLMFWLSKEAEKMALNFNPDIILAHSYRHPHTTKAIKLVKKSGAKVFLVTHAPFGRERGFIQNIFVKLYDFLIGKRTINKFDKDIIIARWEIPFLKKLKLKSEKIVYIPNGLPEEFFTQKNSVKEENKILFLGRVSPIKNLESIIKILPELDKKIKFEIVGPREKDYYEKLKILIKKLNLQDRVIFSEPIYNLKDKAKKIDEAKVFVLPSKSEGMSQALIEAMARGKRVLASNISANKELIDEGKNGFLFNLNNSQNLKDKIYQTLNLNLSQNKRISQNAKKSVEKFRWTNLIENLEELF